MQPDPTFYIESPRLFLSHFIADNAKHCQLIADLYYRSDAETEDTAGEVDAMMKAYNRITERNRLLERLGYGTFLCSLKTESNTLEDATPIGAISLIRRERQETDEIFYPVPDVGLSIHLHFRGKGYAAEGARAIIKYATDTLGYEGVLGFTSSENLASQRTLENAGLEYRGERTLKAFPGYREKSIVYALPGMKALKEYNIADD